MKDKKTPQRVNTISQVHKILGISAPKHPLVSVIDLSALNHSNQAVPGSFVNKFYSIFIKKDFDGKMKYGQQFYDFDNGIMIFCSPEQMISVEDTGSNKPKGWWLLFHPDFLQTYPLAQRILEYGFLRYEMNEALHLSEDEEMMLAGIMKNIHQEYEMSIDHFSQDVMISHLELLLNYANRYYNRQFITRKLSNNTLLSRLENLLETYFVDDLPKLQGLPTVAYISSQLNVSPNYLSDMLRATTGQTTQYYIHEKLIQRAKNILLSTDLTATEIAYQLGFDFPQSFSKLFKTKTNLSPLAFRKSFN
ncbi:helix-turn-helix domain-containing protein [Chryseobacterium terrae]|uniref:AraC family transcriptional regulator n=1 Tax=Chryseobacterium terrae TaxID=3163299 RepID=A0ABW8Y8F8_9FLAO